MHIYKDEYASYVQNDFEFTLKKTRELMEWFDGMKGETVVDMGCGAGGSSSFLTKKFRVIGIDEQSQALKHAREKGIETICASLEEKIPLPSGKTDNVISKDVFEHLLNPMHLLMEINRILKQGGKLYAHVPNQFTLNDRLRILFGGNLVIKRWFSKADEWNYPHIRFFTHKGFRTFLETGGFEIEKDYSYLWGYHVPFIRNTRVLSRISPSLFSPGFTFVAKKK